MVEPLAETLAAATAAPPRQRRCCGGGDAPYGTVAERGWRRERVEIASAASAQPTGQGVMLYAGRIDKLLRRQNAYDFMCTSIRLH